MAEATEVPKDFIGRPAEDFVKIPLPQGTSACTGTIFNGVITSIGYSHNGKFVSLSKENKGE